MKKDYKILLEFDKNGLLLNADHLVSNINKDKLLGNFCLVENLTKDQMDYLLEVLQSGVEHYDED